MKVVGKTISDLSKDPKVMKIILKVILMAMCLFVALLVFHI